MTHFRLLLTVVAVFALGYFLGKAREFQSTITSETTVEETKNTASLALQTVVAEGVSEEEQELIEDFIGDFETYRSQKDAEGVLGLFTKPENEDEQEILDFILGKDLSAITGNPSPRLFWTQGFNNKVGAHFIREMRREDRAMAVIVDELRITYFAPSEEDSGGYYVSTPTLRFELQKTPAGFLIEKYHRLEPYETIPSKYEGLWS